MTPIVPRPGLPTPGGAAPRRHAAALALPRGTDPLHELARAAEAENRRDHGRTPSRRTVLAGAAGLAGLGLLTLAGLHPGPEQPDHPRGRRHRHRGPRRTPAHRPARRLRRGDPRLGQLPLGLRVPRRPLQPPRQARRAGRHRARPRRGVVRDPRRRHLDLPPAPGRHASTTDAASPPPTPSTRSSTSSTPTPARPRARCSPP